MEGSVVDLLGPASYSRSAERRLRLRSGADARVLLRAQCGCRAAAGEAGAAIVPEWRVGPVLAALLLAVALPAAHAEDTISWEEADKHVGENVTVEGAVVDVHCSPLSCLLAFEPSFNRFTAVVQAERFGAMPP